MAKGADFMMARRGIMDSVFPSIEKAARIVSGVERLCLGRRSLAARSLRQQLCGKGRNHISRHSKACGGRVCAIVAARARRPRATAPSTASPGLGFIPK